MSRFQAQTTAVLDHELEDLRRSLGLRDNQKADLLRELTALAAWVVRQTKEGRAVAARGEDDVRELVHPAIDRIRRLRDQAAASPVRLELNDDETRRLAEILDRGFDPPPALIQSLRRLADPERKAPQLTWTKAPA
ncbi:MAG: hypothetical protein HYV07_26510 [Deltaproteobacteria bacterium]|nr:hypothetical protein [Deltaproteobacteria bacterium]